MLACSPTRCIRIGTKERDGFLFYCYPDICWLFLVLYILRKEEYRWNETQKQIRLTNVEDVVCEERLQQGGHEAVDVCDSELLAH